MIKWYKYLFFISLNMKLVFTKEENVAIFRRYITEISCIEGFRHDISWKDIGQVIFRDLSLESAIFPDILHGQRGSTKVRRATVPSHLLAAKRIWTPNQNHCLPPGLTCPLIHNMQQIYIYLNSLYKENIRIF